MLPFIYHIKIYFWILYIICITYVVYTYSNYIKEFLSDYKTSKQIYTNCIYYVLLLWCFIKVSFIQDLYIHIHIIFIYWLFSSSTWVGSTPGPYNQQVRLGLLLPLKLKVRELENWPKVTQKHSQSLNPNLGTLSPNTAYNSIWVQLGYLYHNFKTNIL